jgi:transcriptional regulator with XRE-family HTH domain
MTLTDESQSLPLGEYLSLVRRIKGLSLRQVEEASERTVSNAYLSQLEHGGIAKPSPNILHKLATVYEIPYESLMEKAGYLLSTEIEQPANAKHGRVATFAKENLTKAEEEELLRYLGYLRSRPGYRKKK